MVKRVLYGLTILCSVSLGTFALAQTTPVTTASPSATAAAAGTTDAKSLAVQKLFAQRFDNPPITAVRPTPYGLYEVQLGMDLVYTDENVTFVFDGILIDAKTRQDYTRERQDAISRVPFDQLPFELAMKQVRGDGSRKLAIFEDPNCGYCKTLRKSLGEIDNLTVYTFPYPILSPDSTQKVKNVWCASDRAATWDAWMLKGKVPPKVECEVPIEQMLALGQKLMVRGTPALFFADGSRVGGAIPKADIEKRLQ
ncbi:DsbC family protein [Zwartia sp.]|uniref:DsbC family protein n=1 Tax=Zwartia sp. TaxID=2978004 RepID=UPI002720586E|nr:DsbC family protein [Zwartia sp.]MDO9025681.1 DsbC family protein [Zwartia sp.]